MYFCIVCGQSRDSSVHLYRIPKDDDIRRKWSDAVGKFLPPGDFRICSSHFSSESINNMRLRKGAVPLKQLCIDEIIEDCPSILPQEASTSQSCIQEIDEFHNYSLPSPHPSTIPELDTLFETLMKIDPHSIPLPLAWGIHKLVDTFSFSKMFIGDKTVSIERLVLVAKQSIKAQVKNIWVDLNEPVKTVSDLLELISQLDNAKICEGISKSCCVILGHKMALCKPCSSYKFFLKSNKNKKNKREILKKNKMRSLAYNKKQNRHFKNVILNLKKEIVDEHRVESLTKNLPKPQQEMIGACIKAAKTKGTGNRYTLNWIYECILMKIKSTKLYNHLRDNNILSLPSPSTLSRYIRNIDGTFGFNKEVFDMIKMKTKDYKEWQRHGCLLIDECKITATKKFDKNMMEFIGFVDLGSYTPNKLENTLGDHALVVMFQPFAGHGLQALACFLTKGNINGDIQAKIILECIILCENSGLRIDVVTSDGATWNRTMWRHLGVQNTLEPWSEHPVDPSRKLRMCSDFPHLVKCLRNNLENKKTFQVPEGTVQHSHFEFLQKYESSKEFRMGFKLTPSHIHPKCGEKMCTRLAFQLFSKTTALALENYKDKVPLFAHTDATIAFCKRIDRLVDLMNSSSSLTGLRYQSDEYKELEDFLSYLDLWEQCSPPEIFLSKSTFDGLKATIACTLDLIEYLSGLGFYYLMTTRINQDHLEHFFGMMRAAGGSNSHPESIQVGQIFRLMSLHSLIKPPRGSNISGGDMMKTLLKVGELKPGREKMVFEFDIEIKEGQGVQQITEEFREVQEAFAYFCGYVTRKINSTTDCTDCKKTIIGEGDEEFNSYIKQKSRGFLTYPSLIVIRFLGEVEKSISDVFEKELTRNALSEILQKLSNFSPSNFLGCEEHKYEFSQNALKTYILSRLSICCAKEQKKRRIDNKSRHLAKMAKLQ